MQIQTNTLVVNQFVDKWISLEHTDAKLFLLINLIKNTRVSDEALSYCLDAIDFKHFSEATGDHVVLALTERCGITPHKGKPKELLWLESQYGLSCEDWLKKIKAAVHSEGFQAAKNVLKLGLDLKNPVEQTILFEIATLFASLAFSKGEELIFIEHLDQFVSFNHPDWEMQLFFIFHQLLFQNPSIFDRIHLKELKWVQNIQGLELFLAILSLIGGDDGEKIHFTHFLEKMPTARALANCSWTLDQKQFLGAVLFQVYGTKRWELFAEELERNDVLSQLENIDNPILRIKVVAKIGENYRLAIPVKESLKELIANGRSSLKRSVCRPLSGDYEICTE